MTQDETLRELLTSLAALEAKATPGPWTAEFDPATVNEWHVVAGDVSVFEGATVVAFVRTNDPKEDCGSMEIGPLGCQWNSELIAAMRNALPQLLRASASALAEPSGPTWADIAKLPSPLTMRGKKYQGGFAAEYESFGYRWQCEWCQWEALTPGPEPTHPDNGCLWPRAQAALTREAEVAPVAGGPMTDINRDAAIRALVKEMREEVTRAATVTPKDLRGWFPAATLWGWLDKLEKALPLAAPATEDNG